MNCTNLIQRLFIFEIISLKCQHDVGDDPRSWVRLPVYRISCYEGAVDGICNRNTVLLNFFTTRPTLSPDQCSGDPPCDLINVLATHLVSWPIFRRPTLLPDQCSGGPPCDLTNVQATHLVTWPIFRRPTLSPDQCSGGQACHLTNVFTSPMFRPPTLSPDQCSGDPPCHLTNVQTTDIVTWQCSGCPPCHLINCQAAYLFSILKQKPSFATTSKL